MAAFRLDGFAFKILTGQQKIRRIICDQRKSGPDSSGTDRENTVLRPDRRCAVGLCDYSVTLRILLSLYPAWQDDASAAKNMLSRSDRIVAGLFGTRSGARRKHFAARCCRRREPPCPID